MAKLVDNQCWYLGVAKKFNSDLPMKLNFTSSEYGPAAVQDMVKAFGCSTTAAFTEFQLLKINDDKTYTLVAEKLPPQTRKVIEQAAEERSSNEELVERLVAELSKLPESKPDTEQVYKSYKLGVA